MTATLTLLIIAAFAAGVIIGAFWRWIRALAADADEYDGYDPVENDPEPRVSTQILDGLSERRNDA